MSHDPLEAARQIVGGHLERIDCGRVNAFGAAVLPQRLPFLSRRSAAGSGGRPESTAAWDAGKTGC